ncbi:helix-turn-helix domain-containing protein [Gordonia amicalis]|uniref:helix-turn-helix domain-containing protein n=1 Tax=Gordonia amicalis TaxID=89053 RepID=UPI0002A65610|nr:AraC family transcriptional regulator [Gordonia amicalis]MBA5846146.1 helix-turn-helix domain-containing protein [Gordonia amicalis]MCZ0911255.1 AraC family transcriptional regulator [Gordonia amicalis]MDV7101644.1 AraC family transcriptional regulator [Gordonia amicalis]MDV7172714.1 AraC family transcriptional regulator [Gordonia amicalis]NKX77143.1 helix-turn-helix domain-containing protein [Gordonia amicalis]
MSSAHPARHLLRAKDLADVRFAEPLTVDDMAAAAKLSRAHFSRAFTATFGQSPHSYLQTRRLERAAAMLRSTDRTVADICMSVGLSSVGSFTTSFTRAFGKTPTAYRDSFPPAATYAHVPACVLRVYSRPGPSSRVERPEPSAAPAEQLPKTAHGKKTATPARP